MSAIGEYINITAQGYINHGTTRRGQKDPVKQADIYNSFKKDKVDKEAIKEVTSIINQIKGDEPSDNARVVQAREQSFKILREMFGEVITSVDYSTVTVGGNFSKGLNVSTISRHKDEQGKLVLDFEEAIKKLDKLETTMVEDLLKKDLDVDIASLKKRCKEYKLKAEILQRMYKKTGLKSEKIDMLKKMDNLRKNINTIIDCFEAVPPIHLYQGTMWEIITALVGYVANGTAIETIKKDVLVGNKNVNITMNNNFANKAVQQKVNQYVNIKGNSNIASRRSKVDVNLEWKNTDLKISNKNISIKDHSWVTVVSDSPLLTMIMGMDANFVNHYLNYYSLHTQNRGKKTIKIEDSINIYQTMKAALFYQGLTGDNFSNGNTDIANVMAINDKLTGNILLISMGDIVERIQNNLNNISVKFNDENLAYYYFKNTFVPQEQGGLQRRLLNLVQELHAVKVKASFNVSDFGIKF